jgi:hypothetical protein
MITRTLDMRRTGCESWWIVETLWKHGAHTAFAFKARSDADEVACGNAAEEVAKEVALWQVLAAPGTSLDDVQAFAKENRAIRDGRVQ